MRPRLAAAEGRGAAPGHMGTQRQPTSQVPQVNSWGFPENPSSKIRVANETLMKERMHRATSLLADR